MLFNAASLLTLFVLPIATLATPFPNLETRACAYTCGTNCYTTAEVTAAVNEGYTLYKEGKTLGSDEYPHEYEDYEGFDFPVSGPYEEFPILSSGRVYSGGSPGADRVVFNTKGTLADLITHTGASDDDFLECQGDS